MQRALILSALLIIGCASSPAQIKAVMDPWVGKTATELVSQWGAPSSVFDLPDGGKVYTWAYAGAEVTTGMPVGTAVAYTTTSTPGCRIDFTIGPDALVRTYRTQGFCQVHK